MAFRLDVSVHLVDGGPPDVLGRLVADEIARWTVVAQKNHISVDR